MLLETYDDEIETVEWVNNKSLIEIFDCGCCDDCLCDYKIECSNCNCSCCSHIIEEDGNDEDIVDNKQLDYNIIDFTIDVIEDRNKERKVKINLNLTLENDRNITINLDIKSSLYLQIADELINK